MTEKFDENVWSSGDNTKTVGKGASSINRDADFVGRDRTITIEEWHGEHCIKCLAGRCFDSLRTSHEKWVLLGYLGLVHQR